MPGIGIRPGSDKKNRGQMKITRFETFLANAGLRNYVFLRLTTDTGQQGIGEATLEWQEKTVETLCHEWLGRRCLVGRDPFDIGQIVGDLVRVRYRGGSTVMTAISGAEVALWDLVGKACGQPVYKLFGGRYHAKLPAYANGWYGGATKPAEFAERARDVVARGYGGMKFDPFGIAWRELTTDESDLAIECIAKVPRSGRAWHQADDRVSRTTFGQQRGGNRSPAGSVPGSLVRGASESGARRAVGRGPSAQRGADCRRRAVDDRGGFFADDLVTRG